MRWVSMSLKVMALAIVALALGAMTREASAQYPPPTGSASVAVSNSTPAAGTSIAVSARVVAPTGAVVPGVACTFQVVSQPGSDATVNPGPVTTDTSGVATSDLNVGTTPGAIVVGVQCGELSSQVIVSVAGAAQGAVILPSTGTGPVGGTFFGMEAAIVLLATGVVALTAGSALVLRTRNIRRS